jgi:hypothetical protein
MQTYTPCDLAKADYAFDDLNLAKVRGEGRKELAVTSLRVGRGPVRVVLHGYLATAGINRSEHEQYGEKWSVGLQLDAKDDADALVAVVDRFGEYLDGVDPGRGYALKDPFKDEVLYLKAKTNGQQTAFTFASNFKLHPKKPNPDVTRYMPLEVVAELGVYVNVREDTAGIFFTVRQVTFRQHEEDAVEAGDVESQTERKVGPPAAAPVPVARTRSRRGT